MIVSTARFVFFILLIALSACNAAPTTAPAVETTTTVTPRFNVVTPARERPTLPPSWTPPPTETPPPPTDTLTPTLTPSPAPTLTADEICERFRLTDSPREGQEFTLTNSVAFIGLVEVQGLLLRVQIVNRETGEGSGGDLPNMQVILLEADASAYGVGTFDWTLSLISPQYGEICAQSGYFVIMDAEATAEVTTPASEATAESTAEPTRTLTPDEAAICDTFTVEPNFDEGEVLSQDYTLIVELNIPSSEVLMRFVATNRQTRESLNIQIPGGEPYTMRLPVDLLPVDGVYDWSASIYSESLGERCIITGSFVVASVRATTPAPTARPTRRPSATPASTATP